MISLCLLFGCLFFFSSGRQRGWSLSVSVSDVCVTSQASCFYFASPLPSCSAPPTVKKKINVKRKIHNLISFLGVRMCSCAAKFEFIVLHLKKKNEGLSVLLMTTPEYDNNSAILLSRFNLVEAIDCQAFTFHILIYYLIKQWILADQQGKNRTVNKPKLVQRANFHLLCLDRCLKGNLKIASSIYFHNIVNMHKIV